MSESCIQVDELARVVALPQGDPGRGHLDRCSRCRSLADMLLEFSRVAEPPADAGFHEVDDRLLATIADLTGIPARSVATSRREVLPKDAPSRLRGWWFGFTGLRLAGAFAALVVVGALGITLWRAQTSAPVMRAFPSPGAAAFAAGSVREVDGGVELSWNVVLHATSYRVVFLDDSLRRMQQLAPTASTSAKLDAGALPAGLVHGRTVGWEVEALAGGDVLATSPTRALRLP